MVKSRGTYYGDCKSGKVAKNELKMLGGHFQDIVDRGVKFGGEAV